MVDTSIASWLLRCERRLFASRSIKIEEALGHVVVNDLGLLAVYEVLENAGRQTPSSPLG